MPELRRGGEDRFARTSPLTGGRVPQRIYRQHLAEVQATRAGLTLTGQRTPRAEVERARKAGTLPVEPKSRYQGGRWYPLGQAGGRRKRTSGRRTLAADLRQAARQGRKIILHVKATGIEAKYPTRRSLDMATLGGGKQPGFDPSVLLDCITAAGDVDGGVRAALLAADDYAAIGEIASYELKTY